MRVIEPSIMRELEVSELCERESMRRIVGETERGRNGLKGEGEREREREIERERESTERIEGEREGAGTGLKKRVDEKY
jgi:hypothetical protein